MGGQQALATTFPSGSQTASALDIAQYGLLAGVFLAADYSGSYMQVRVSMDGVTYSKLATGAAWYSAAVSAGAWNTFEIEPHLSWPYVRFESTATAQGTAVACSAYIVPF